MRASKMVIGLALLALLAGCGSSSGSTGPWEGLRPLPDTTEATAGSLDPLAQKWGGTADLGDLQITVTEPVDDTANLAEGERMFLEKGKKAIYCMVTIVNSGEEPFGYSVLGFTLYDAEGQPYDSLMPISSQPDLGSGDLLTQRTVKGAIGYALPEDATPARVDFQRTILDDVEASWGY